MECIERNYGRIPISIEVLLLCQRFWSNQPNLNNFNQLREPLCEQIDRLQIQSPRFVHEIPVPTVPVPPASSINVSLYKTNDIFENNFSVNKPNNRARRRR